MEDAALDFAAGFVAAFAGFGDFEGGGCCVFRVGGFEA